MKCVGTRLIIRILEDLATLDMQGSHRPYGPNRRSETRQAHREAMRLHET